ncbi:hypothetical protein M2322_003012 [Rhodoblastus acidophilus]|nr:hypothetical protein [Rhodoblastus acidophilus]
MNRADVLRRLGFSCTNSMASLYNARGSNWWRDDLMRRVAQALRGDDFARGLPLNVLIAKQSRRNGVVLPRWVPSDLRDDFFDVAELYGEEAAASHCRALKREMEAGHA